MSEFALVMPILAALIVGMVLSALYAYRSAATNYGLFLMGVGAGTYNESSATEASKYVLWGDIRDRIDAGTGEPRQARSSVSIEDSRPWIFGIDLIEAQRGGTFFRLWRFYPGPPPPGVME